MEMESLRGELERLFELDELLEITTNLLGLSPEEVGGTEARATYVRELTSYCDRTGAIEALCDAVAATRPDAAAELLLCRDHGLSGPPDLAPGDRLGPYEIESELSEGSQGACFVASDGEREIRVKVLHAHCQRDKVGLQRFLTHCRLAAQVQAEQLPQRLRVGSDGGRVFVAHDLLVGEPLSARLEHSGPLTQTEALAIARQVASGLAALHQRGLVHGNLKLQNIIVAGEGDALRVQLQDSGANLLRTRRPLNGRPTILSLSSPATTAPEWLRGLGQAPTIDVYAVGAVLYELVVGRPPLSGETEIDIAVAHVTGSPTPAAEAASDGWISHRFSELVARLLDKDPAQRPQDGSELLEELELLEPLAEAQVEDDQPSLETLQEELRQDPGNPDKAQALEALATGEQRVRVYQSLAEVGAQLLENAPDQADVAGSLLLRAARGLRAAGAFEQAVQAYKSAAQVRRDDHTTWDALAALQHRLERYDELIEGLLNRLETEPSAARRADLMERIGNVYAQDLSEPGQAAIAFTQALCETPDNPRLVRQIEKVADADPDIWSDVLNTCSEAASDEERTVENRVQLLERMGYWYAEKQERPELSLPCFQTALQLAPKRTSTLEAMATVYRNSKMWSELGDLLVRRAQVSITPTDARMLRVQAAEILDTRLDDAEGARQLYERILEEDPSDLVVTRALGRLYERADDTQRLLPLLRRQADSAEGKQRLAALCKLAALELREEGDPEKARALFQEVLDEDPSHAEATEGLNRALERLGQHKALLANLHRAIEQEPTPRQKVELWLRIADVYEREFLLHADAAAALESVLALDPANQEALSGLARLYRVLERWHDLAKTLQHQAEQSSDAQARLPILQELARVWTDQVGDLPRAIQCYEQLVALSENKTESLEAIAGLHQALGNTEEAVAALSSLADLQTETARQLRYYQRIAKLLDAADQKDEALQWYKRIASLDPGNPRATQILRDAYVERGDTAGLIDVLKADIERSEGERAKSKLALQIARLERDDLKNLEAARAAGRQALQWDLSNWEAQQLVGDLAFEAGDYLEAIDHYESLVERVEALSDAAAVRILERLLAARERSGQQIPHQMLAHARALADLQPDNADAVERAAALCFDHGAPDQAADLYRRLTQDLRPSLSDESYALALFRLGEALRRAGDGSEALAPLQEAATLLADPVPALVSLAGVYESQEKWAELLSVKKQLLERAAGDEEVEVLIDIAELSLDRLGDTDRALASLSVAREQRPDDRRILTRLMQVYSQQERWADLVEVVDQLAQFVEESKQRSKYLMTAAMVSARHLGRRKQAIDYYNQVLELDPDHAKALSECVVLQIAEGDTAAAESALQTRLKRAREENNDELRLEMLDALFALYHGMPDKLAEAIEVVEETRELKPNDPLQEERLGDLYERDPATYSVPAIELNMAVLRRRPDNAQAYRRLRQIYTETRQADEAWCLCQVLSLLKLAEDEESRFFERGRSDQPVIAQAALGDPEWNQFLMHPLANPLLTQVFALIEPVVVATRCQPFEALGYNPQVAVDLSQHPYPLAQLLYYASSVLGIAAPPTFENHHESGGLLFLNSQPPSIVMGLSALQHLPSQTAAFIAARQLTYYRPGFHVRHLVSSIPVLKAWLFAALKLCSPSFPIAPELEGSVREAKAALDATMPPATRDMLVDVVSRLLHTSTAIDLKDWVTGVDLTADRAGLLVANDLKSVTDILKTVEDPTAPARERRLQELILYAISKPFFEIRRYMGVALESD